MESKDTSTTGEYRARCKRWSTCSVISIFAVSVLVGLIGGFGIAYAKTSQTSKHGGTPHSGLASSQTGNIEINNEGLDLRIYLNTSGCDGPTCTRCRTQVSSSHHMPIDPFDCYGTNNARIRNSSCYLCNGECKTLSDLLHAYNKMNRYIMCPWPKYVDCCDITKMGNLGNVCGVDGEYKCYGDGVTLKPICKCPHGITGDRCQDSNTETLNCRCYKPAFKFCGQEDMIECNNVNRGLDVTQCHMDVDRRGERHNCVCNKADEDDSDDNELDSCVIPHTDAHTNGSVKLFQDFLLYIVLLVISLVDKT